MKWIIRRDDKIYPIYSRVSKSGTKFVRHETQYNEDKMMTSFMYSLYKSFGL